MRISKLYLVACAVALGAGVATIRADDNPAQAAARAALEEKMRELSAQPAPTNVTTSAPATSARPAQSAVTAAPATPPPAQNPQTAAPAAPGQPVSVTVTPSGAVRWHPANPPPATATMPETTSAVTPVRTPAPPAPSSDHGLFGPVPPPSGGGSMGTVSQITQPPASVQTPSPAPPQKPAFTGQPNNAGASSAASEPGFKPILAPPLPISSTQQAQLQALLEKYDANAITPEQYQAERAKILAEH